MLQIRQLQEPKFSIQGSLRDREHARAIFKNFYETTYAHLTVCYAVTWSENVNKQETEDTRQKRWRLWEILKYFLVSSSHKHSTVDITISPWRWVKNILTVIFITHWLINIMYDFYS
jgi:hypothetical protein